MIKSQSDSGKFRTALKRAGFNNDGQIFSDPRKNTRRLKMWFASAVFESSPKQQQVLEKSLKELFGDRYLTGYFIQRRYWTGNGKALCIRLAKK